MVSVTDEDYENFGEYTDEDGESDYSDSESEYSDNESVSESDSEED